MSDLVKIVLYLEALGHRGPMNLDEPAVGGDDQQWARVFALPIRAPQPLAAPSGCACLCSAWTISAEIWSGMEISSLLRWEDAPFCGEMQPVDRGKPRCQPSLPASSDAAPRGERKGGATMQISKSDFLDYRSCAKSWWLKRRKPDAVNWPASDQPLPDQLRLFEGFYGRDQ